MVGLEHITLYGPEFVEMFFSLSLPILLEFQDCIGQSQNYLLNPTWSKFLIGCHTLGFYIIQKLFPMGPLNAFSDFNSNL